MRPIGFLAIASDDASQRDAPRLRGRAREPKAPERDDDAHHVAVRREPAFGLPHGVEAQVLILSLGEDAVELHAERIGHEHVGPLAVAERIQVHDDGVVAVGVLSPGDPRSHLRRVVVAHEHDVETPVVVSEVGSGALAHGIAVSGVPLAEIGGPGLGQGALEEVLELEWPVHPRNRELRAWHVDTLSRALRRHAGGRPREEQRSEDQ